MQVIYYFPHLVRREVIWIVSEYPSFEHVVDVCPHGLKRNTSLRIICYHVGNIHEIYAIGKTVNDNSHTGS